MTYTLVKSCGQNSQLFWN